MTTNKKYGHGQWPIVLMSGCALIAQVFGYGVLDFFVSTAMFSIALYKIKKHSERQAYFAKKEQEGQSGGSFKVYNGGKKVS